LYEVGFNHFWRAAGNDGDRDVVFYQGHAAPGIYSRAFLEGRFTEKQLENFRRELNPGGGLSSYPHPWLMPDFWEYPSVSMGLSPIMAIYHARFIRYLEDRGLKKPSAGAKVWAFLGDGETDEPESLGAITLPSREKLDNLIFVVNCNLQRLDGPVRGNGQIVQELGSGVPRRRLERDQVPVGPRLGRSTGEGPRRPPGEADGRNRRRPVPEIYGRVGRLFARAFLGRRSEAARHGQAPVGRRAQETDAGRPRPVQGLQRLQGGGGIQGRAHRDLARTIKGYGMGEAGEGKNIAHQQKKLSEDELRAVRDRFGLPVPDEKIGEAPYYRPDEKSPEIIYVRERRKALGGSLPVRSAKNPNTLTLPSNEVFEEFYKGTGDRTASTTMVFVRLLSKLLRDKDVGKHVVPIVPDEARTFGMEALFRQVGIYSHVGQLYEPVDMDTLLYYKESTDGQILEEGINEAGSLASFIAAGTAYSIHHVNTIPFFIFYSMFGFQRVGRPHLGSLPIRAVAVSSWAARPGAPRSRAKGFSIRTATASCWRTRCPTASRTIRRLPMSWPSSSRTASGGCTRSRRASFIT
jgi:pyruvate dehydrogenase E1 component